MTKKKIIILCSLAVLLGMAGVYFLFPGTMFHVAIKAERAIAGLEQRHIDVKGIRIEYLEGGQGDYLLLLHGFGANKDNWVRIGKHLTPHFRVIAPDLPGFGESGKNPDGDYLITTQARFVKAFVQTLGIKSFHLGGSSMGGYIAGAYASSHPQSLKSLLLVAPGGVVSAQTSEMHQMLKAGKPNPLVARNVPEYEYLLDFVFVKRPFIPLPIKKFLVQEAIFHQSLNSKIFEQILKSRDSTPLEEMLKGLPIKTLVVWGVHDRVLHVSGAKIIEAVMPKARVEVMDAMGHLPMIENPEKTAGLYLRFLN